MLSDSYKQTIKTNQVKPFLRWAGSKKKLLPELSSYCQKVTRYIEPFAGSARLFFHLAPPCAILGDLNSDLVNCYNMIKTSPGEIFLLISEFLKDKETYYRIRSQKVESLSPLEQAVRFIYLNRYCFNGLYRTRSKIFIKLCLL